MSINIEELKPKPFKIKVKGQEVECKPPKLSQMLLISRIGNVFSDPKQSTARDRLEAEKDIQTLIGEIIPELKDVELDLSVTLSLIEQIMSNIQPNDNKELARKGVKFDTDPKASKTG